jgi:hypothetical protein
VGSQPLWAPWKTKKKTKKDKISNMQIFSVVKDKYDFCPSTDDRVPWPGMTRFFETDSYVRYNLLRKSCNSPVGLADNEKVA